jgi:hypothetical protein
MPLPAPSTLQQQHRQPRPYPSRALRFSVVCHVRSANRLKYAGVGQRMVKEVHLMTVSPDASDAWRLDAIAQTILAGGGSRRSSSSSTAGSSLQAPRQPPPPSWAGP